MKDFELVFFGLLHLPAAKAALSVAVLVTFVVSWRRARQDWRDFQTYNGPALYLALYGVSRTRPRLAGRVLACAVLLLIVWTGF